MEKGGRLDIFLKYISDWEIIKRNEWLWNFLGYPPRRKRDPQIAREDIRVKLAEISRDSVATNRMKQGREEQLEWEKEFKKKSPYV